MIIYTYIYNITYTTTKPLLSHIEAGCIDTKATKATTFAVSHARKKIFTLFSQNSYLCFCSGLSGLSGLISMQRIISTGLSSGLGVGAYRFLNQSGFNNRFFSMQRIISTGKFINSLRGFFS